MCQQPSLAIPQLLDFVLSAFRTEGVDSCAQGPGGLGGGGGQNCGGINSSYFGAIQFGILFRGRSEKHFPNPFCTISDTGDKAQGHIEQLIAVIPGFRTTTLACVQCVRVWCMRVQCTCVHSPVHVPIEVKCQIGCLPLWLSTISFEIRPLAGC